MSRSTPRVKFSLSLVAVIALMAVVIGVVAGRDYGLKVGLFGPTSETDVNEQVQLVENSISRGADAIVLAPNSSDALNSAIKRARAAGTKVIVADTSVTTPTEGFIGTDNIKAGEQAGQRMCQLVKQQGKTSGQVMIESSVAGIQTLKDRDAGFRRGFSAGCRQITVASPRFNNNDINTAASQVNDVVTANRSLVGIFADNNTSGTGAARAIKDNRAAARIPVVAFDTDPQENAALADGSIDALVVQNPYFFGYQGVVEAGTAAVGTHPPLVLDPGAVVAGKAYGPITALHGVTLELRAGEVMCLAGENGAGKSTLIKVLKGAIRRDAGEYLVDGEDIGSPSPAQAREAGIGVVYQELSLLPDLSVGENLLMGQLPSRRGVTRPAEMRKRAADMLARVGLDWLDPGAEVASLSLATQQLVEIAKVLGESPRVLIFDEPTTALSESETKALLARIHQLRDEGHAIMYVSHHLEEMFEIGDTVSILRDGRSVVDSAPMRDFDHDSLIASMVGRKI